ncbi:MAG: winged helix-turn-helix domain-containing protein [Anaerolineae bacterium]
MMTLVLASAVPRQFQRLGLGIGTLGYSVEFVQSSAQVWHAVLYEGMPTIAIDSSVSSEALDPWRLANDLCCATDIRVVMLIRPGRNKDRVRAFRLGVAQCLSLPVSAQELAACLDAVVAHGSAIQVAPAAQTEPGNYTDPILQIDMCNRKVTREGYQCSLSPRELVLFQHLFKRPGQFIGTRQLCHLVWREDGGHGAEQRLKIYISVLRRKIEPDPRQPRYIVTRRGQGYAFMPQNQPVPEKETERRAERASDPEQGTIEIQPIP